MYKPETILNQIAKQHGITILGQSRLKGMMLDMMPTAERKHINVLKRAIDEQIGGKLLEMQHDDPAVRQIKVNTLKEKFKNDNALDDTAYYIVDCFVYALGWNTPEKEFILPFKEIKIGDQIWADRNLDVSHFRNGDPIPEARTTNEWRKAEINKQPAWCYYDNDPENGKIYGKLFNYYAVNDPRCLAPDGWHVSYENDWNEQKNFIGGYIPGYYLKSKSGWADNGGGKDEFGFSALPGGARNSGCSFNWIGEQGYWWSSQGDSRKIARPYGLVSDVNFLIDAYFSYDQGYSVRCIKNLTPKINENQPAVFSENGFWKIIDYSATKGDEKYGMVPGVKYKLMIAQSDGQTKSGRSISKGDRYWFAI